MDAAFSTITVITITVHTAPSAVTVITAPSTITLFSISIYLLLLLIMRSKFLSLFIF
jgi:hypothetical protein